MSGYKKAETQSLVKYSPLESDIGLKSGERVSYFQISYKDQNKSHTKR
jgi:hypothetical protein